MVYYAIAVLAALCGIILYSLMIVAARADERAEREWRRRQEQELLQLDWRVRVEELRRMETRGCR